MNKDFFFFFFFWFGGGGGGGYKVINKVVRSPLSHKPWFLI